MLGRGGAGAQRIKADGADARLHGGPGAGIARPIGGEFAKIRAGVVMLERVGERFLHG